MNAFPPSPSRRDGHDLALRILVAASGGYALCWGLFVFLCAWLPYEKVTVWYLTGQLAPLPFVLVLLAAFAAGSAGRVAAWSFGLAGLLAGLGSLE
ncbi:hypothetical protein [Dechloromonas sp. CZR5]|uniref:hypothetical protein n=1 Tax=Dechloromonas sp. CZR5 TaxID=2608630 RepID=UPI00123E0424|nr:hypothetical protein [Dechloromonas sp. CZR5]